MRNHGKGEKVTAIRANLSEKVILDCYLENEKEIIRSKQVVKRKWRTFYLWQENA
jgi:hypothetical protein